MSLNFTSLYGRWLGITYGSSAGTKAGQNKYLSGDVQGLKFQSYWMGDQGSEFALHGRDGTQALTSANSSGTVVTAGGITTIAASNASTWTLAPPFPGALKVIQVASTGASGTLAVRLSTANSGNIQSTAGSTFQAWSALAAGSALTLYGVSTAIWQVLTDTSSVASGGLTT